MCILMAVPARRVLAARLTSCHKYMLPRHALMYCSKCARMTCNLIRTWRLSHFVGSACIVAGFWPLLGHPS